MNSGSINKISVFISCRVDYIGFIDAFQRAIFKHHVWSNFTFWGFVFYYEINMLCLGNSIFKYFDKIPIFNNNQLMMGCSIVVEFRLNNLQITVGLVMRNFELTSVVICVSDGGFWTTFTNAAFLIQVFKTIHFKIIYCFLNFGTSQRPHNHQLFPTFCEYPFVCMPEAVYNQ